ncbi:hypothetical protein [Blastococcus sp. VKM Ac-2987]|uniref:hypothetical protein n=1 Tax=Blastococcus sp. VKM Ac-2987 TaxID=3004141 RepID=UPI0022AB7690|nr:hypothetical protein [Blastococcus sp. VKM Ac-2987]MCZ2860994.1 hypothetical protein [Blastococcus sp. VKM Ac-2987]
MIEHERESLRDLLTSYARIEPIFQGVAELVFADSPAARAAVVDRHPQLATEPAGRALELVVSFAVMAGLVVSLPDLQELQAWLRGRREATPARPPAHLGIDTAPREILGHFVAAAVNADKTYARTRDASDLRRGIEVWEQLAVTGLLAEFPPESLVEAHLTVAMLYARRFEIDGRPADLERAFDLLRSAQHHVEPGSDNETLLRLASANWLMVRFDANGDPADLDRAIAGYGNLIARAAPGSVNGAVARANLGRALHVRYRRTGAPGDLARARASLVQAATDLPRDHPALVWVQQALAYGSLRPSTGT